jgi:hypothetical protein
LLKLKIRKSPIALIASGYYFSVVSVEKYQSKKQMTMKASLKFQSNSPSSSAGNVIAKLLLLGGLVFGSIYVVLMAFEALTKAL